VNDSLGRSEVLSRSSRGLVQVSGIVGLQIVVSLGTQVVLARLVAPEHFGALAFATVFAFAVHALINTHGDRFAIQAKGEAERFVGTTIAAELVSATVLFFAVFLFAPSILALFDRPDLVRPLRVLALTYFAIPLTKPRALIERQLLLFRARLPTLIGQVVGSAFGIVLAIMGAGLWSLVAWRTSTLLVEAFILWGLAGRTIKIRFNRQDFRESLSFGWPLMASALRVRYSIAVDERD